MSRLSRAQRVAGALKPERMGRVIYFPINAPGMGRFQILNFGVIPGLEIRFWVVVAIIVSLTLVTLLNHNSFFLLTVQSAAL